MKKQKPILSVMGFLMGGACGWFGVDIIMSLAPKKDWNGMAIIIATFEVLLITYFAIFINIFVHEIGHMIFGMCTGYRFSSIRFLSLMLVKAEDGKIRLKRFKIAGTGGQCLMLPPEMRNGTYPYFLYNMGGCIFNLLTGVAALTVGIIINGGIVSLILNIIGIVGVFTCLINGIPIKSASNDGYNAFVLLKSKTAQEVIRIQMNIMERQIRGIATKDMPEQWFEYMEDVKEFDNLINVSAYVMTIGRYEEKRDFEKVKEMCIYAEENIKEILPIHEGIVKAQHLFAHLVTDMDKDKIEGLTGQESIKLYKLLETHITMNRIWYAYYLIYKHDGKAAQKHLDRILKAEKTYPYPADYEAEKEFISYVDDIAQRNKLSV